MRKDNKATEEQLKELYEAASVFKQVQPWKWLYDLERGIPKEMLAGSEAMAYRF